MMSEYMSNQDYTRLLKSIESKVKRTKGRRVSKAVGMFDLFGSTPLKLKMGHTIGTRRALAHNIICRKIAEKFGGTAVKELGDGILIVFNDPVQACLAAINIRAVTKKAENYITKVGLTFGLVEEIKISNVPDVLGTAVDRCARLQSSALPGQILIDTSLRDSAISFLKENSNILLSESKTLVLKGIGKTDVYELSTTEFGFIGFSDFPFTIHEEGRLSIQEKVAFMRGAASEVIELGTGLATFAHYFKSRRTPEFKEHVANLLNQDVVFKCLLLDPDSQIAEFCSKDRKEPDLVQKIRNSIRELKEQREEFLRQDSNMLFEIYAYNHFPYFHAVCVDPSLNHARMTVSHYMHGVTRANTPVLQFSKSANPALFSKYWVSIDKLLKDAKKL